MLKYDILHYLANNCDAMCFLYLNSVFYVFLSCNAILTSTIGFLASEIKNDICFTFPKHSKNRPFCNTLF